MNITYPALIHKEDNAYWLEFPDIEGCQTFAETLDELLEYAREALGAHCGVLLDNGEKLPVPSKFADIKRGADDIVAVVRAPITDKKRSVKKTLTIPAWLNSEAENANINFSQTLQEALIDRLGL